MLPPITHLVVGVDLTRPPRLTPTPDPHPRKLLLRLINPPPRLPLPLPIHRLSQLPLIEERIQRLESASSYTSAQPLEALPDSIGFLSRAEGELVDLEIARAEEERVDGAGEVGRSTGDRVEERKGDLRLSRVSWYGSSA